MYPLTPKVLPADPLYDVPGPILRITTRQRREAIFGIVPDFGRESAQRYVDKRSDLNGDNNPVARVKPWRGGTRITQCGREVVLIARLLPRRRSQAPSLGPRRGLLGIHGNIYLVARSHVRRYGWRRNDRVQVTRIYEVTTPTGITRIDCVRRLT